jgi:dTDP-4-amino-4,6-dideoxy-D-galactose acyltransferase
VKIELDAWLAEVFGYPVFSVTLQAQGRDEMAAGVSAGMLHDMAQDRPAFFYAKVPTDCVGQAQALNAAGFAVIDTNVTLERSPTRQPVDPAVVVRDIRPNEHTAVMAIAAACFVYSRFHLDPLIPTALANAVKREWVENYCRGKRGERLWVTEANGRLAGFLAVLATEYKGAPVRVIDLIGVDPTFQGHGVGRGLVRFFIGDSAGRASTLRVGTQAANVPSLRLYEACGFRVAQTSYVLHAHVREGEVLRYDHW